MEEIEPITIVWSDGTRWDLQPETAAHIWKLVKDGQYSSPKEFIEQAIEWLGEPGNISG